MYGIICCVSVCVIFLLVLMWLAVDIECAPSPKITKTTKITLTAATKQINEQNSST